MSHPKDSIFPTETGAKKIKGKLEGCMLARAATTLITIIVVLAGAAAEGATAVAGVSAGSSSMKGRTPVACWRAGTLAFGSVALSLSTAHIAGVNNN